MAIRRSGLILTAVALATVTAVTSCYAAKHNKKVEIGDKAPVWSNLPGTDDAKHSFADLKEAKAVVVVFNCNKCPVAVAYEDRLIQFVKDYKEKGVSLVVINVNKTENLKQMKERAEKKDFNFPYVFDESQEIAKAYGATCTPHVFLLDGDRTIAYMGSFDDSRKTDGVKKHYLTDAVDAVLAGKKPETTETKQFGCSIKWK